MAKAACDVMSILGPNLPVDVANNANPPKKRRKTTKKASDNTKKAAPTNQEARTNPDIIRLLLTSGSVPLGSPPDPHRTQRDTKQEKAVQPPPPQQQQQQPERNRKKMKQTGTVVPMAAAPVAAGAAAAAVVAIEHTSHIAPPVARVPAVAAPVVAQPLPPLPFMPARPRELVISEYTCVNLSDFVKITTNSKHGEKCSKTIVRYIQDVTMYPSSAKWLSDHTDILFVRNCIHSVDDPCHGCTADVRYSGMWRGHGALATHPRRLLTDRKVAQWLITYSGKSQKDILASSMGMQEERLNWLADRLLGPSGRDDADRLQNLYFGILQCVFYAYDTAASRWCSYIACKTQEPIKFDVHLELLLLGIRILHSQTLTESTASPKTTFSDAIAHGSFRFANKTDSTISEQAHAFWYGLMPYDGKIDREQSGLCKSILFNSVGFAPWDNGPNRPQCFVYHKVGNMYNAMPTCGALPVWPTFSWLDVNDETVQSIHGDIDSKHRETAVGVSPSTHPLAPPPSQSKTNGTKRRMEVIDIDDDDEEGGVAVADAGVNG